MAADPRIWLRTHRAKHDQTQAQSADALGISRFTLSRWESGDGLPSLEHAVELGRWAGCSLDEVAAAFGLEIVEETLAEEAARLTDATP